MDAAAGSSSGGAAAGIVAHQHTQTCHVRLVRRYKRFLADVVPLPVPVPGAAAVAAAPSTDPPLAAIAGSVVVARAAQQPSQMRRPRGARSREGPAGGKVGTSPAGGAAAADDVVPHQAQEVVVHCPNTGPMIGLLDWCVRDAWQGQRDPSTRVDKRRGEGHSGGGTAMQCSAANWVACDFL